MNSQVLQGLLFVLILIILAVIILAAVRFFTLRSRGTTVLLRLLPAKDSHSWRHGLVRYNGEYMEYFKLRSVLPRANMRFNRLDITLNGIRSLDDDEASFMPAGDQVMGISVHGKDYEIASDAHGIMALNAWVEAAPSKRKEKLNYHQMRQRASRFPKK
ncbi:DUF2550 domain-containing protein [Corynebacterium minutissimum]|uniref:DUF2550 domain-containing protein n=1 Tax=Corynebacterium sp. HMSC078H07 TaxID=1739379 RepID=UPI0008A4CED9|nr:DUF2550 domain-containing protein [Corynebacterium sp. HMSC078H07]OFR65989.1 hypothetical protein HMPREF2875_09340 [Corynebacterium sp. HMSC078H07]